MSFSSDSSDSIAENSENELDLVSPDSIVENSSNLNLTENNLNHLFDTTEFSSKLEAVFAKLSIADQQTNNMAPPNFDSKLLDIVPKFDGNPLELSSYLETSNRLINTYWNTQTTDCVQNVTIIYGIYSKLIGKAREVYSICVSKDWKTVKDALIAHFGDQRDENGLLFDLDQLRQSNNESSLQFHTRVMSNLSALHNFIDTHNEIGDETSVRVKKDFYNLHALKIFLAGLKEPLGSTIRAMKPKDLAEARQQIISENNIRHLQKPFQNNHSNNNPGNKQRFHQPQIQHPQHNFNPNYQNSPNFNNFPRFNQNHNSGSFPRGPMNIQPRPVPPQRFFTNRQVFGPPRNVWKPNPERAQYLPKPTPMSGVSFASSRPNDGNNFQLHNVEEPYPYYYDPLSYGNVYDSSYETYNYSYTDQPQPNYDCAQSDIPAEQNDYTECDIQQFADNEQNFQEVKPPNQTK